LLAGSKEGGWAEARREAASKTSADVKVFNTGYLLEAFLNRIIIAPAVDGKTDPIAVA
jgi:hypothetical protein